LSLSEVHRFGNDSSDGLQSSDSLSGEKLKKKAAGGLSGENSIFDEKILSPSSEGVSVFHFSLDRA
jgi:hypothetical protein